MKKNDLIAYLILILVASITTSLGLYIGDKIRKSETPKESPKQEFVQEILPSQFPDYDAIKGEHPDSKIKNLNISVDCPSNKGCVNDKPATVNFDGINKKYIIKGQFSRAYLYIDALVDYNRPLTSWDDIYFSMNEKGGHLIPNSNILPVPPGNSSKYLYNLNSISYFPGIHDKEQSMNLMNNVNFFNLLSDGNNVNIHTSVSSNRPGRVIKEISIYYECLEGSDCSMEEIR